jgi:hypothetical protein
MPLCPTCNAPIDAWISSCPQCGTSLKWVLPGPPPPQAAQPPPTAAPTPPISTPAPSPQAPTAEILPDRRSGCILAGVGVGLAMCVLMCICLTISVSIGLMESSIRPGGEAQPEETPQKTQVGVGERAESAGMALTVENVERTDSLGEDAKAASKNVYVIVDLTIENASGGETLLYDPQDFTVVDLKGQKYSATLLDKERSLRPGELNSGEMASGSVIFEVPGESNRFTLYYEPAEPFTGYRVIRVDLGQ